MNTNTWRWCELCSQLNKFFKNYELMLHDRLFSFSPITRIQENNIVSANKAIIETHVVENAIKIIPRGELKRLQ